MTWKEWVFGLFVIASNFTMYLVNVGDSTLLTILGLINLVVATGYVCMMTAIETRYRGW